MKKQAKQASKSVKFDGDLGEEVVAPKHRSIPTVQKWVVPYHLPIILYAMFHYGLTSNTRDVMVKGYGLSVLGSVIYGYVVLQTTIDNSPASDKKEKKKQKDNVVLLLGSSLLVSMLITVPVMVVLILLGSPVSVNLVETFWLAAHLALIISYPVLVLFKLDLYRLININKRESFFCTVMRNPVLFAGFLSAIGTWIGVVPIPLDWDRPWQNWPITLLVGGYLGSFGGAVFAAIALTSLFCK